MNKIVFLICLAIFTDHVCRAQTNSDSQTNLEESASGVHLSIALSNNVIDAGSITIKAAIQNQSTNIIRLVEFPATTDFDVLLINGSGRSFKLTPPRPLGGSRVPIMLKPEERRDWVIPIAIGNELKPGEYVMKASRNFSANGKWFVMRSNSLKISIK
jgi:hypothetical protein